MKMLMVKSFILLLVSLLLSQQCLGGYSGRDMQESCKRRPKHRLQFLCELSASRPKDPRYLAGLGLITLDMCSADAKKTASHVDDLLKNPGLSPDDKMCLKDCSDLYSDAVDTLKQCRDAFKKKEYKNVNVKVSAVTDDSDTCESGFKEKGRESPLSEENKDLSQLGFIALAITNFLGT